MFNQNILLIKYSSVYEVYLVSAVTFNLKHTVLYLNRSSSKIPLITSHIYICRCVKIRGIGVRAGGARGAAAPPNFGRLRFFGQQEKIWVKPVFKDVSMFFLLL